MLAALLQGNTFMWAFDILFAAYFISLSHKTIKCYLASINYSMCAIPSLSSPPKILNYFKDNPFVQIIVFCIH